MDEIIKVLIVDDQMLVRDGISTLLDIKSDIEVVGVAEDGADAIEKVETLQPDVILMDIRMPNMDGIEATEKILSMHDNIKIIMLTTFDDQDYIIRSLKVGSCGYLLKDIPTSELAQAVRQAYRGIFQYSSGAMGKLVSGDMLRPPQEKQNLEEIYDMLTKREVEILQLIAEGESNREIANRLFISEGTVKNHVSKILNTLNLRDRVQAAIFAIRKGVTPKKE